MRRALRAVAAVLAALAVLAVLAAGWLAWQLSRHPDLAAWEDFRLPLAAHADPERPRVTVTFLGVATLLFSDGETSLLTDGWFTRVPLGDLLLRRPVSPDAAAIERGLARAGIGELAAVMPVHSHYDHAQDAAEVAKRTGALLVGSETTAWIGRGGGLPEERIRVVEPGEPLRLGKFTVTHVRSKHVKLPQLVGGVGGGEDALFGNLSAPLVPPVPVSAYPEGGSWSIRIEHPLGTALVQGSAGFVPGALEPYDAHTVFLGVGALSRQGEEYTAEYVRQVVEAVGATRIVPIHHDDLTAPTDAAFPTQPPLLDDVEATLYRLLAWARAEPGREIALAPYWHEAVLFPAPGSMGRPGR